MQNLCEILSYYLLCKLSVNYLAQYPVLLFVCCYLHLKNYRSKFQAAAEWGEGLLSTVDKLS